MPEDNQTYNSDSHPEPKKVWPTLFVGVGGTGKEICLRVRRRILNHVWGDTESPLQIGNLTEFPVAQFINFDLDALVVTETGKAAATDPLSNLVKFSDGEKLILPIDLDKYMRTDGALNTYSEISSWFPLTRKKTLELGIDPSHGAGQIRSLARLYFFDKYESIKTMIEAKIRSILTGVSMKDKTDRLKLELEPSSLRVIVIASTAGGTGSGAFLDMGYLSSWLAKKVIPEAKVNLCLMLPSGYSGYGKTKRTEANTYAALMELETCMRQGLKYIETWNRYEKPTLPNKPYDEVFLFDTGNLALKKTAKATDVFDMVADILFEDFTSQEFGAWKRSTAVNQQQHKTDPFCLRVEDKKYPNMQIRYSKAYSSFGQSIIDTQLEMKRNEIVCAQVNNMLKVFFGITTDSGTGREIPPPTPDDGRTMLKNHANCSMKNFNLAYPFVSDSDPYKRDIEFSIHKLNDEMLYIGDKPMLGYLHDKINKRIEEIIVSTEKDQRLTRVDDLLNELERDLGIKGNVTDAGARGLEEAIQSRRKILFNNFTNENSDLVNALWTAVDNKEKGGLDFTIQLIEKIKDVIDNESNGLVNNMENAQKWFSGLCQKLKETELQTIREHINQVKGKGFLGFGGTKEAQAEAKLQQMGEAIRWYIEARLREISSRESIILLKDLSSWLGEHKGLDEKTNRKRWDPKSFAGKLSGYEKLVTEIMNGMNEEVVRAREATKQSHAAYQVLRSSMVEQIKTHNLEPMQAMEWAREVFDNIGKSRVIFQQLENEQNRATLIGRLRNLALRELPSMGAGEDDPLFKTLELMTPSERKQLFQHCLEMAMPWIEANLYGNWKVESDQYSCIIGVNNRDLYENRFLDEFKKVVPSYSMMGEDKIKFYNTGVPGKLTCYTEISGVPLSSMSLISNWRSSYNEESKKIPVHTHKDKTLFVHPMELTPDEVDRLAEHFKLYIEGIIYGSLKLRIDDDDPEERLYRYTVSGEELSIGNERNIRSEGIAPEHFGLLKKKIIDSRDRIKTPLQFAGMAVLYDFYAKNIYPPAKIKNEKGETFLIPGFCNILCTILSKEAMQVFSKKAAAIGIEANDLISTMKGPGDFENWENLKIIDKWTGEIDGSKTDVYENEVGSSHKPKRVLKAEFFQPGWLEKLFKLNEKEKSPGISCPSCSERIEGSPKFCPHCGNMLNVGKKCAGCGNSIEGNPKFCPNCGAPQRIASKCPGCGSPIEGNPKFCPECGKPI